MKMKYFVVRNVRKAFEQAKTKWGGTVPVSVINGVTGAQVDLKLMKQPPLKRLRAYTVRFDSGNFSGLCFEVTK